MAFVIGEIMDLSLDYRIGGRLRWLNSAKDIVNTMLWPVVCAMVAPLIGRMSHAAAPPEPEGRQATGTGNPIL